MYDLSNATWRRVLVLHLPVFIDQPKEPHKETAFKHEHRHSASCWEEEGFRRLLINTLRKRFENLLD